MPSLHHHGCRIQWMGLQQCWLFGQTSQREKRQSRLLPPVRKLFRGKQSLQSLHKVQCCALFNVLSVLHHSYQHARLLQPLQCTLTMQRLPQPYKTANSMPSSSNCIFNTKARLCCCWTAIAGLHSQARFFPPGASIVSFLLQVQSGAAGRHCCHGARKDSVAAAG